MSAWKVYSKDGSVERCELKSLEYGGTAMGERAVTATFHYHSEVDFEVFDYIEYRGEKFELEAVPTVKKVSSFEYIYELRFVSLKYELERCEMRDLIPYDNEVVYPTPLTFSFTGNVRYLTERIQACLDALYGSGAWNIIIADGVESEEKNITIAQQNCWNALALVSSTYGLSFYIKGRTITIGGEQPLVGHTFEYGRGNGLYEIERASDTNTGIVTKLRAYGSTRNLDYSYPKRPEWSDSALPVTFAFSPLRLMLPSFKTDGKTDYVLADSATIAKYGIREASMVYDDIYPSITGATYNGQAIDEIKNVEEVDDNSDSFVIYLHDLGFDLEEHLATSNPQISMKTGAMQGYTFTITKIEKQYENTATTDVTGEVNPDEDTPEGDTPEENLGEFVGYRITLNRISAEGGENYNIPNSDWSMKAGDKFVLLNILMPQKYIRDAENRLQARAEEYLEQYSKTNFSYNIGLHDKFLIENPYVYNSLIEGSKLRVRDTEIGIDEEVTIQSITITENTEDTILPQVKVTLNNEPSASTLERIQGRIDALANETAAGNFATQSEIMAQYRKKLDKPYFDKLFVAMDANGKEIQSNDMTTPVSYIKAKYNFAVVGGITSFVDDVDLDLPSIYDGLAIDNQTIVWEVVDGVKTLVAKGSGSGEGTIKDVVVNGSGNAITDVTLSTDKTGLEFTKGLEFAKKKYVDDTLKGYLPLTGGTMLGSIDMSVGSVIKWGDNASLIGQNENLYITSKKQLFIATGKTGNTISPKAAIAANGNMGIAGSLLVGQAGYSTSHTLYVKGNSLFEGSISSDSVYPRIDNFFSLGSENLRFNNSYIQNICIGKTEINEYQEGVLRIEGNLLVTGGITAFADQYSSTSIMDALVCDEQTITVEEVDGVKTLKVICETGNSIDEEALKGIIDGYGFLTEVKAKDSYLGKNDMAASASKAKFDFDNNEISTTYLKVVDAERRFVTTDTEQIIEVKKNFKGGLFVNGGEIKYNGSYWQLDGDLLVTGGITAFADRYDPTSIMDAIVTDEQTITVEDINGVKTLKVIGGGSGGGVDEEAVKDIIDSYLTADKLPLASTSSKGIASFDSNSFNVSSGHVTFNGGKVKVVTSTPSTYESNTLYVIVG